MIDEIDKKIIEMLQQNARTPFTRIAEEIGLSEGAVRKRIDNLERDGVAENSQGR